MTLSFLPILFPVTKTVGNVVDELLKKGCKVVYESMYEVHVSGMSCQEELKIIHKLVKPK